MKALDGVYCGAIHCGIKDSVALDLAYIYVPGACASACVLTQNKVTAPPVQLTNKALKKQPFKAVIINSGNANALTGDQGMQDAKEMQKDTAKALGLDRMQVAVASTGIIAKPLPMDAVRKGIPTLLETQECQPMALAQGILTTDLVEKTTTQQAKIGKKTITITGVAKGSGMIAPNMATMLGFLVTDVKIPQALLTELFDDAIAKTFNQISVDTDTSTNDMAMIFAQPTYQVDWKKHENVAAFKTLLLAACETLALAIVKDGEGATKVIDCQVTGAASDKEAALMAKSIVESPLVKTAAHGADPNFGRILAAAGKAPIKLNPDKVTLFMNAHCLIQDGVLQNMDRAAIQRELTDESTIEIRLNVNLASGQGRAWGCDLSKGYIDINVAYT